MAADEAKRHEQLDVTVEVAGGKVAAGTEMSLTVTASCPEGCDLTGHTLRILDGDTVVAENVELAAADEGGFRAEEIAVPAPAEPGSYTWIAALPALERDGIVHAETTVPFSFEVVAHATSVVVWDVPSAVTGGDRFDVKVGVKCLDGCDLRGQPFEITDHEGARQATGVLGEQPWQGTSALYFAEVELTAPAAEGNYAWEAKIADVEVREIQHRASARGFGVKTVGQPECEVTIRATDKEKETPIAGLHAVLHPFRAVTDAEGVAKLRIPKGHYKLHVSGFKYFPFKEELEVTEDVEIDAVLAWEPRPEIVSG